MAGYRIGALKRTAAYYGMTVAQLETLLETHSHCYKCKLWLPHAMFAKDSSRSNGLSRVCYGCRRVKQRKSLKGRPSPNKGRKHTPEARANMSRGQLGNQNRKGKPCTPEQRKLISERTRANAARGKDNYNWKGGVSNALNKLRQSPEYSSWRTAVFERDNYTCQDCGDDGGNNLHAHHIKSFAEYPDLRFEVSNGITLCETCHWAAHGWHVSMETLYHIEISYKYALDMFGNKTELAKAYGISVRTLNKIINRTHRFESED